MIHPDDGFKLTQPPIGLVDADELKVSLARIKSRGIRVVIAENGIVAGLKSVINSVELKVGGGSALVWPEGSPTVVVYVGRIASVGAGRSVGSGVVVGETAVGVGLDGVPVGSGGTAPAQAGRNTRATSPPVQIRVRLITPGRWALGALPETAASVGRVGRAISAGRG